MSLLPKAASASLLQFPCNTLRSTYHFMRAGESLLEEQGVWGTNPLFLTNRENALSQTGMAQVEAACEQYLENLPLSMVRYPLAANAMDTADIISEKLHIGRNIIVPEYTYLDQRGIGKWDMQPLQSTQEAVWAMDFKEAGEHGSGGLPPPNDDGTPNETLGRQVTRLRQLLSLLETYGSGDSILLIFPDGTGPALASCLIAGIPLNRVHELHLEPGQVRLDVNYDSVRALLSSQPSEEYVQAIGRGSQQLKVLRSQDFISAKDQVYVEEQEKAQEQEAAWKEAIRKRRQEKDDEREHRYEIQQTAQQAGGSNSDDITSNTEGTPVLAAKMGAVALAAVGIATSLEPKEEEEEDDQVPIAAVPDEDFNNATLINASSTKEQYSYTELEAMEELIENTPILVPEFSSQESSSAQIKKDRIQLAEEAMQEYMDQDDGSGAFLGMMEELMSEDV